MKREFQINYSYIHPNQLHEIIDSKKYFILVTQNPEVWEQPLSLAKIPVILFLIGNETYNQDVYDCLNRISYVKHLFLYNPPFIPKIATSFFTLAGYILDGGLAKHETPGSVWRDFRISMARKSMAKKSNIKYNFTTLNQGYSNNFAYNFSALHKLSETQSLFDYQFSRKLFENKKHIMLEFIGQKTNRRRENMLRNARKFGVKIQLKTGFGGTNVTLDNTFTNSLIQNMYTIVPPGHFNNYNHRYAESLICGSIPAILANNSLDPTPNSNWTNSLIFPNNYSSRFQFKFLTQLNYDSRLIIWSKAFLACQNEVYSAKQVFSKLINPE